MTSLPTTSIVVDSNVWISALVFGGEPRQVFERIVSEGVRLVVSAELLSEVRRVLSRKFPDFAADFDALLIALQHNITVVSLGSITVTASRDADDNRVLETAMLGNAKVIISGDNDLLVLGSYEDIAIVKPGAWLGETAQTLAKKD